MKHLWSWCYHLKQDLCLNFPIVGAHVLQKSVNLHELCVQLLHMSFSILSKCAFSFISRNDWFSLAGSSFEAHHTFKDGFYSSLSAHFVCALFWVSFMNTSTKFSFLHYLIIIAPQTYLVSCASNFGAFSKSTFKKKWIDEWINQSVKWKHIKCTVFSILFLSFLLIIHMKKQVSLCNDGRPGTRPSSRPPQKLWKLAFLHTLWAGPFNLCTIVISMELVIPVSGNWTKCLFHRHVKMVKVQIAFCW